MKTRLARVSFQLCSEAQYQDLGDLGNCYRLFLALGKVAADILQGLLVSA